MNVFLSLVLCFCCVLSFEQVRADDGPTGILSGRLLLKSGAPMSKGLVYIFNADNPPRPMLGKYWKIPDGSVDTDKSGRFSIKLPEGAYYLAAIQRKSNERLGPPVAGDFFYASHDQKFNYRKHVVYRGKVTSIGTIKGITAVTAADLVFKGDLTGIEGTVRDEDGKPLIQALVVAYDNPAMQGPPMFSALRTGADGKYLLGVHQGGMYYLRVRHLYGGGKPEVGDLLGAYGTVDVPLPVQVESGRITKGIDIKAEKFKGRMAPQ